MAFHKRQMASLLIFASILMHFFCLPSRLGSLTPFASGRLNVTGRLSAAFELRQRRNFVHFPQSGGILDPFEPLFALPHHRLVHVSVLLLVLHVVVLVLVVQQGDLDDGGDVLLSALCLGRRRRAAFGSGVRLLGRENAPVAKVRRGAALLLLRQHLLLDVSLLDDQDGFGSEAERELNLLLAVLFAVVVLAELSARVHGARPTDAFRFLRFGHRQPGTFALRFRLSRTFALLLLGFAPQIP